MFEAQSDGHVMVLNSLIPPVVARYVLLKPQKWHIRASAQVQVLGCPSAALRPRSQGDGKESLLTSHVPHKAQFKHFYSPYSQEKTIVLDKSNCVVVNLVATNELHS